MGKLWQLCLTRIKASRFFSGEAPQAGPIVLTHRRIFIVPTAQGLGYLLLLLVLLLVAFVYNNNLVYLLTFVLAGLFVVTILHTFRSLAGLSITLGAHQPIFAGQTAALPLYMDNPSRVPRYQLEISLEQVVRCDIAAFAQSQVSVCVTPQQRGWYHCGIIRISCRFPLGLLRAWSLLRFTRPLLVYPKPTPNCLPLPTISAAHIDSGALLQGSGEDFYALQEYQAGDSLKRIHWKAYAKGQGLMTKHYGQNQASELWLDFRHTPGYGPEERLSQLCRWVLDAEAVGIPYGLNLPGICLQPAQGAEHCANCLRALALLQIA